jgi:hypothetical protein
MRPNKGDALSEIGKHEEKKVLQFRWRETVRITFSNLEFGHS